MAGRASRSEAFRLLKVVSRALEPEVRSEIVAEVRLHTDSDDPIFLANWLRHTFMKWLPNVPVCECGSAMDTSVYRLDRGIGEIRWVEDSSTWTKFRPSQGPDTFCGKIERYACPACHRVRVVSRENDPLVLLRTRVGRCGEFAILYTCIMLALGHQVRILLAVDDDHVWTEVRVRGAWVPVDVSAEDVSRLIDDRYLFAKWGWKLSDLYAITPGQLPILVGETYQKLKKAGAK